MIKKSASFKVFPASYKKQMQSASFVKAKEADKEDHSQKMLKKQVKEDF